MRQDPRQVAAYKEAQTYIGLREISGSRHAKEIVDFFADVGHSWVENDETSWCAAFLGAMLQRHGLPLPPIGKRLSARSYGEIAERVALEDAQPGDIVTFWRKSISSWEGHVAFFIKHDPESGEVWVLGGNQKNAVGVDPYAVDKVLEVRRFPAPPEPNIFARLKTFLSGIFAATRKGVRTS